MLASILGILWAVHFVIGIQISLAVSYQSFYGNLFSSEAARIIVSSARLQMLWQWCAYTVAVCTFHLLEFFVTAICNPSTTTANSFLVNHSTAYTMAFLVSWTEFGLRFCFFPNWNVQFQWRVGLLVIISSQILRSAAMATAGESFHHIIQKHPSLRSSDARSSHVLITHGIYRYLRHPSYVGFYYWSIGTQLLLGNFFSTAAFAAASWMFFARRIPYEEGTLYQAYPEQYPEYAARTWVGIPFIKTRVKTQ